MTRRGSLVYYFTAVVVGCLFLTAAILVVAKSSTLHWNTGRDFFLVYFLCVSHGWIAVLVFAFLLRRSSGALAWNRSWQWLILGGGLAILVLSAWLLIPGTWLGSAYVMRWLLWLLPSGDGLMAFAFGSSLKVLLPAIFLVGAATAFVLYRVHHTFEPSADSPKREKKPRV